jgi:hypothetical protein
MFSHDICIALLLGMPKQEKNYEKYNIEYAPGKEKLLDLVRYSSRTEHNDD